MALTITATPNPTTTPPSIRLDLSDPAGSVTSVTVLRVLSDRSSTLVRTSDGKALTLDVNGSARTGLLMDYEAPFGQPITYVANGTAQAETTLDVDEPWLVHPGRPEMSVPLKLRPGSWETRTRAADRGVFPVLGRSRPIVVTGGAKRSTESQLVVATETLSDLARLDALLGTDRVLLMNIPVTSGLGVRTDYISIGDAQEARPSTIGTDALRHWRLPYLVVDAPLGGSASASVDPGTPGGGGSTPGTRTWASLALQNGTWQAAKTRYATWDAAKAG